MRPPCGNLQHVLAFRDGCNDAAVTARRTACGFALLGFVLLVVVIVTVLAAMWGRVW